MTIAQQYKFAAVIILEIGSGGIYESEINIKHR